MPSRFLLSTAALLALAHAAAAEETFPATLVGHAVLPAATLIDPPADAPPSLALSGKYSTPDRRRTDAPSTVPGKDGLRPTGLSLPFEGQPVQGFSGIALNEDGSFWTLSDNGFGNKLNSPDAMLMLHRIGFDWKAGTVDRKETVFLSDPNGVVPFPIVHEGTPQRYLTGGDFDVESIQPVAGGFWIGDEFGPYLVRVDGRGVVTDVRETVAGDVPVRSPDHPALTLPANPAAPLPEFNLKRSGGFEGLAQSPDGTKLYGLLEGALYQPDGSVEETDGRPSLRIAEFDVAAKAWTGRTWIYPLSEGGVAIGDFNMVDATTALVIERDNGAGDPGMACADPEKPGETCFAAPARFKRVFKIEMSEENVGAAVRKIGSIDLLAVADPNKVRRQGGRDAVYDMPFVTIENVDVVDATHIVVGNDNNLPFSAGRALNQADDNEFVLLEVGDFLRAK